MDPTGRIDREPFKRASGVSDGVVIWLRKDQMPFRSVQEKQARKQGKQRKHGPRLTFKEPDIWSESYEFAAVENRPYGCVEFRGPNDLYTWRPVNNGFDIVQMQAYLERAEPPAPIWFAWQRPAIMPKDIQVSVEIIWQAYQYRQPIDSGIRFRKQRLWLTLHQIQLVKAGYCWALGMWMCYLAKPIVQDQLPPWQKPQYNLTPTRVRKSIGMIFRADVNQALWSKSRGIPPGWPEGKPRKRRKCFAAVRKGFKRPISAVSIS